MYRLFILMTLLSATLLYSKMPAPLKFTPAEQVWINKQMPITYVYDIDWAPFEWKNEVNQHTGIIADILALISEKSNLHFEAINTDSWDKAVYLAENNKVDMYSAIPLDIHRAKYMHFTSQDIFQYHAALVKEADDTVKYNDLKEDLIDKTIAIVKSSALGLFVKRHYPQAIYVEVEKTEDGFTLLSEQEVDLFAINSATAEYNINHNGFDDLTIATKLDKLFKLKIAISKTLPPVVIDIIDKTLSSIPSHEINQVYNKWMTPVKIEKTTNWKLILYITTFALVIIVFFMYRQHLLKEINQKLKLQASTDPLTELFNRRFFFETIDNQLIELRNKQANASLIVLDIDDFKRINDEYGHIDGDNVLESISKTILSMTRKNDIACRWGGDEFVIFLPDTDVEAAYAIAEKIRHEISNKIVRTKNGHHIEFKISLGVSKMDFENDNGIDDVINRADHALYEVKQSGGNETKKYL